MNTKVLNQLLQYYIDDFEKNNTKYQEYYKWQICNEFHALMDNALSAPVEEFLPALKLAKKCSYNIIDSFTQPFGGLVDCAKTRPEEVQQILRNLYTDDGNDVYKQAEIIKQYFAQTQKLLEECDYSDSYRYKQDFHAVSGLLFLYDPEHHYMYKAEQAKKFADAVEFYDDWGSGTDIRLDVYYRFCDEIVKYIKENQALLDTNQSRYDGRLKIEGGELHPDIEKHILLFDIIYCLKRYKVYDSMGISKKSMKERKLFEEQRAKAKEYYDSFVTAQEQAELLDEGLEYFGNAIKKGDTVIHRVAGEVSVDSINERYLTLTLKGKQTILDLPTVLANGIVRYKTPDFDEKIGKYREVFKNYKLVSERLERAARYLKEYEDYLE